MLIFSSSLILPALYYIFSKSVKQLRETEKTWILLENDYRDVMDGDGNLRYRIKECVDDFPYEVTAENGTKRKGTFREKRVVTYNPKLAEKQRYEINRQVEKVKKMKASHAKRDEYGDSVKYVIFEPADKKVPEN